MNLFSLKKLALGAGVILALSSALTLAEEQFYRWIDDNGVTTYGKTPPPGVDAELVTAYSGNPSASNTEPSSDESAKPLTEEQKKLRAQREAQCKQERERLATLKSNGARIRMQQEDGSTRYLSPDEILSEVQTSEKFLSDACK